MVLLPLIVRNPNSGRTQKAMIRRDWKQKITLPRIISDSCEQGIVTLSSLLYEYLSFAPCRSGVELPG